MLGTMWGVIARVVAAAAVISVIQHTATQIYNGWREDQDRHETQVGPQQLLAPRKGDDVEGDDDDDGRKDSGGGERSGGSGGSSRSFSSASAAAAAAAAARGENSRGGQFGGGGYGVQAMAGKGGGMVLDQRGVSLALRAARLITRR